MVTSDATSVGVIPLGLPVYLSAPISLKDVLLTHLQTITGRYVE